MAKINLRAYIHEIETMIDQNQFDQAISHARHILKIYPKNIQAYRLLGKAFLESQRYGDAADIFQRVLSAVPDDFVSHVGMSIIREDESNLDEAIWHMERAFEVQPANNAITGELRRLYGRRDGLEPPKVRLTRGALARMYTKGELYPQAIAELRAALADDPERQDLQSLLAQAYFQGNQRVEAANVCNTMLKKMPYSLEANRILANILAGTDRAQDANQYRQRMIALDPYYGQLSPNAPVVEKVPDAAVLVEKFVYIPGQTQERPASQPDWAASLGVQIQQPESGKDVLPEWLLDKSENQPEAAAPDETPAGMIHAAEPPADEQAEPNPDADIPDWMKAAGWQPATAEAQEAEADFRLDDLPPAQDDAAPGEIPDWLKEIAPPEPASAQPETVQYQEQESAPAWMEKPGEPANADLPDWFSTLEDRQPDHAVEQTPALDAQPAAPPQAETGAGASMDAVASADDDAAFAWLESLAARQGASEALFTNPEDRSETPPDWVTEAASREVQPAAPDFQGGAPAGEDFSTSQEAAGADLPDWLKPGASDDWLSGLDAGTTSSATPALLDDELPAGEFDAWLPEPAAPESSAARANMTEMPDWLKDLEPAATSQVSPPEDEPTPAGSEPTAGTAEMPDWLKDLGAPVAAATLTAAVLQPDESEVSAEPAASAAEMPDWLKDLGAPADTDDFAAATIEPEGAETPVEPAASAAEMPDWLKDLGAPAAVTAAAFDEADEVQAEPAGELPDWLSGLAETPSAEAPVPAAPEAEQPITAAGLPAWLQETEQPAAMHADFPMLFGPKILSGGGVQQPEAEKEVSDTQPTRVRPAVTPEAEVAAIPPAELAEETTPAETAAEIPDWLKGLADEPETPLAAAGAAGAAAFAFSQDEEEPVATEPAELPDWLKDIPEISEKHTAPEATAEAQVPAWADEVEEAAEPVQELPDWLKDIAAPEETPEASAPPSGEEFELPEQPAGEVVETGEKAVELPDWLADLEGAQDQVQPETWESELPGAEMAAEEATAATAEELPDWLKSLETEAPPPETAPVAAETPVATDTGIPAMAEDDAFAWLEMLAARQGATEALQTTPDERPDAPPEWVTRAAEQAEAEQPVASQPPFQMEAEPVSLPEDEPEAALVESVTVEETPATTAASEEQEIVAFAIPGGSEAETEAKIPEETSWLFGGTPQEPVEEPVAEIEQQEEAAVETGEAERIPELPGWLKNVDETAAQETSQWIPPVVEPETATEAFQPVEAALPPMDLNTAGLIDLERLPGVGYIRAQAMLEYRRLHGGFNTIEELLQVEGIDQGTYDQIAGRLFVSKPEPEPVEETRIAMSEDDHMRIIQARNALIQGDNQKAMEQYVEIIRSSQFLPDVVRDLTEALYRHPMDILIWQTLGDAYMRAGNLQEALDAYTKAEELLR